jgi:hypothetical protein
MIATHRYNPDTKKIEPISTANREHEFSNTPYKMVADVRKKRASNLNLKSALGIK